MGGDLSFSVVVPTRNRLRSLARCLIALEQQDVRAEFEILVVDDGSADEQAIAAVVAGHPRARCIRQGPSGSAAARNRGAREARAPVVLLLDDDCEPQPQWARHLLSRIDGKTPVAAGRCINADPSDALGEATQVVLDYLTERSGAGDGTTTFAPTLNLGCLRDLLLDLPFDARYVHSGADRDWCRRLVNDGHRVVLEPRALLCHRQLLDLRRFWRKHREYGAGSARYRARHAVGLEQPRFYSGLLREGFRRGFLVGLAVCLAQIATAVGYATVTVTDRRRTPPLERLKQALPGRDVVEAEAGADGRGDVGYAGALARHPTP